MDDETVESNASRWGCRYLGGGWSECDRCWSVVRAGVEHMHDSWHDDLTDRLYRDLS